MRAAANLTGSVGLYNSMTSGPSRQRVSPMGYVTSGPQQTTGFPGRFEEPAARQCVNSYSSVTHQSFMINDLLQTKTAKSRRDRPMGYNQQVCLFQPAAEVRPNLIFIKFQRKPYDIPSRVYDLLLICYSTSTRDNRLGQ